MPKNTKMSTGNTSRTTTPRGDDVDFYSNATLARDRRHMLWFNKHYSKVSSKGNIVGWYLDGPAHEPFWHNRKTRFIRNPRRKTQHISTKVKAKYQKLILGKISTDDFLTAGELKTLSAMFEDKSEEVAPEPQKPRLTKKEQVHLRTILNNFKNPGRLPTPPEEGEAFENEGPKGDDAAAMKYAYEGHQRRMEVARSGRGGKVGKKVVKKEEKEKEKDEFEEMWQGQHETWLEGT